MQSPFYKFPSKYSKSLKNVLNLSGKPVFIESRRKQILPRSFLPYFNEEISEQVEDHYRRLLFLFKPWNSESTLKGDYQTYGEAYEEFLKSLHEDAREDIKKFMYVYIKIYFVLF